MIRADQLDETLEAIKRHTTNFVHPTAIVAPNVTLRNCHVGPFCVVGSDHGPLELNGATIRSHTIIEGGSQIGDDLETGHHVLIRTGNTIGRNFRIGSYSSLEGGATIGDYCRFGGRCEMTQGILGDFVRLYVGSVITDNPLPPSNIRRPAVLNHGAVLCANVTVIAGVKIGMGAFVGSGSVVSKDVPDAKFHDRRGGTRKFVNELHYDRVEDLPEVRHPWTMHFKDDYPRGSWQRIDELSEWILAACRPPKHAPTICPECREPEVFGGSIKECKNGHRWEYA